MKTKEIDVWVGYIDDLVKKSKESCSITNIEPTNPTHRFTKAKLIIELPEQKIEITESVIERLYNMARDYGLDDGSNVNIAFKKDIKKILGFKDE